MFEHEPNQLRMNSSPKRARASPLKQSPAKKMASTSAEQVGPTSQSVHQQQYNALKDEARRERDVALSAQSDNERLMQQLALANEQLAKTNKQLAKTNEQLANANERLQHTCDENETLFAEKAQLQKELQGATSYISAIEEKCVHANQTSLDLLANLGERESEIETLKQYVLDLKARIAVYIPVKNDAIDKKLAEYINNYPDRKKLKIMFMRESSGVYEFGSKRIRVEVQREKITIKVGGGYLSIDEFLDQYTPDELAKLERKDPLKRFNEHVAVQKVIGSRAGVETSPVRRPESPAKSSTNQFQSAVRASSAVAYIKSNKKTIDSIDQPSLEVEQQSMLRGSKATYMASPERQNVTEDLVVEEANKVLKRIKKDDLYFIQSLKVPSPNVVLVLEFYCHMFGLKPKKQHIGKTQHDQKGFFELSRPLLGNPKKFLDDMLAFDKDNIDEKIVRKVNLMLSSPTFSMQNIAQASATLVSIMKWVQAMMKYHESITDVRDLDTESPVRHSAADSALIAPNQSAKKRVSKSAIKKPRASMAATDEFQQVTPANPHTVFSLNAVKQSDIAEIKAYAAPPKDIQIVLSAVATILGQPQSDWKKMIGQKNFINQMQCFDANRMSAKQIADMRKFTNQDDFEPQIMRKKSAVAASMCEWVLAIEEICKQQGK